VIDVLLMQCFLTTKGHDDDVAGPANLFIAESPEASRANAI
jgi:hypothetical protein